jgi:hypothetical protein
VRFISHNPDVHSARPALSEPQVSLNVIHHRAVEAVVNCNGLHISIDTSAFQENSTFACIDSDSRLAISAGNTVHAINDLEAVSVDGVIEIPELPRFGWLSGPGTCLHLVPDRKAKRTSFTSDADGEFGVEIY